MEERKIMGTAEKKPGAPGAPVTPHATDHGHRVAPPPKKGTWAPLPDGCQAVECKAKSQRLGFCPEHFEQFKFGLIKKTGEPVPDYERKFEHYQKYRLKLGKSAPKAA